ncbi:MAG TPA: hypothetical protein QGF58_06905 [Myxococcota bacterium]|nr:hypothetical protein [Myxococcota bacterium]
MLLLSLACWKTPDPIDFTVVPFDNDLSGTTTGVVETIETDLDCPDGEGAKIYVVWDETWEEQRPVAIVLHSSAFDYVIEPQSDAPLIGEHWAATGEDGTTRMTRRWGVQKVWETLGMHPQVEPAEENYGTIPASLLDAGVVGVYPTNCWGDLWHDESPDQVNDKATEYLDREGGTFAWWQLRWMVDATFAASQGITPSALIDSGEIYLVGLGDGALGVADLIRHEERPALAGVLLDSPVDDLDDWAETPGVGDGLARIYFEPGADDTGGESSLAEWSIKRLVADGGFDEIPTMLVHSSVDPRVPSGNVDGLVTKLEERGQVPSCVVDTGEAAHVQTNADIALARDVVNWLTTGESSRCPEE